MEQAKRIQFMVQGEPFSKQRPRASSYKGFARIYTPQETLNYENRVLASYLEAVKGTLYENTIAFGNGLVSVVIVAYFGLNKADYNKNGLSKSGKRKLEQQYCTCNKDIDNIVKIILDPLNKVAYNDDSQVVMLLALKRYAEEPRVEISLQEII